ncbi:AlpA family phage regulatory protein [Thalassotalea castellviae]|uniref:AlpA family phage regulatory protein n=1 Tax=Thalassotalea castellviae TaxID=3075612 RepID=A0ABU2ZYX6_9GAMM|nr:AlpA family phage regulatory protein [Thalassotalea sp. W431]MDT0602537.1 AlpA family phage regulatory protein [Thalassotalea sp. W431]
MCQCISENKLSDNVSLGGRSVAWVESEVAQWVENVIGRRNKERRMWWL